MSRIVVALVLAIVVLNLSGAVAMAVGRIGQLSDEKPWLLPVLMQTCMLVFSFGLILLLSKGKVGVYGFVKPAKFALGKISLFSLVVGTVSAVILSLLPGSEHPLEKAFTVPQVILFVWIYAPICEEVFTRGLIQSYLAPLSSRGLTIFGLRLNLPVIVAALLFGFMHIALLQAGMAPLPVSVVVVFGLIIGLIAGYFREQTGSLVPAIIVHSLCNITGSAVDWTVKPLM